nr:polysaccharide lyase family protein [uncultured Pedobacter sp.]
MVKIYKKFPCGEFFSRDTISRITVLICLIVFGISSSYAQQWNSLGNDTQISSVASNYTSIAVLQEVPYVVYVEGTAGKVKRRNSSTGTWDQVGGAIGTNITYTRIYNDQNNKLYVSYVDVADNNRLAVVTYNTSTQAWEPLVSGEAHVSTGSVTNTISQFSSTPRSGLSFDKDNIPYITFSERSTGNPFVKKFVNGVWETLGGSAVSTDITVANSIAIDSNKVPFIVYIQQSTATSTTGVLKVFRFNLSDNTWSDVSPPNPVLPGSTATGATVSVRHSSIAIGSDNNPIVSYFNTGNSNRSSVIRYNVTTATWEYLGVNGSRDAPNNTLVSDAGGNVYNAFGDLLTNGGSSPMARVYKMSTGTSKFKELVGTVVTQGVAQDASIGNINVAIGRDTSKPYIVYTRKNSANITTPVVAVFSKSVATQEVTGVTKNSATAGGEIWVDAGTTITERGIVYGTAVNPTTLDTKIADANGGFGSFSTTISGLIPGTLYHVRAYAINDKSEITYGSDEVFTTLAPDAGGVIVQDNGGTVVLKNGIVEATITKATATVTSIKYNGLELISGGYGGGSLYWSWNMPNYQNPSGCTYTLTADPHANNFDYAEIKLHMNWNGSGSTAAMDVDVYYSLPRGASGVYAAATLSHPTNYPENPGGEWRMAGYPNPMFDWMSVDSLRNRIMASGSDLTNSVAVNGAPKEVTRLTSGVYNGLYECKYDYSADFGDINVWGWSSTANKVGLWVTAPSKEYYPGGPKKRELMCHATPVLLNMLGGTHYGMGDETTIAAGEDWKKTYGPFLIYCNKVSAGTTDAPMALWNDAKAQALTEQAAWPYTWFANSDYKQESARGTVTGKLTISDIGQNSAAANMWVGLAVPPTGTTNSTNFQQWSKNYQFWVKTDADGNFTIPHVLPGNYSLFAFGPGAAGQLSLANYATVVAGNTTSLGTVNWTPTRVGRTVWEIGKPDREASEFYHGKDWWTSNVYPDTRWAKFMNYVAEFQNDVNFNVGQSNIKTEWNFVQPYDKNVQSTSPNWKVNFTLQDVPTVGSNASVYVALAENFSAALILTVNGINVTSPSTGIVPDNSSNAMIRKGIHGAFSEVRFTFPASYLKAGANQISFTLRVTGGASSGEVMYDYVRLEGDVNLQLPIKLGSFDAKPELQTAKLTWITLTEQNNDKFEILRSANGVDFIPLGTVKGSGNSSKINSYSFKDIAPLNGINYYKLIQYDFDGVAHEIGIKALNFSFDHVEAFTIYPNPAKDYVDINCKDAAISGLQISLYDLTGKTLLKKKLESKETGIYRLILPKQLIPGQYVLSIDNGKQLKSQQLMIR